MIALWMLSPVAWVLFAVRELYERARERQTALKQSKRTP